MIKKSTKILAAVAGSVIALNIAMINFSDFQESHIRSKVGKQSVMILNLKENSGGSGFYLKTKSGMTIIMTNRHVCELAENGSLKVIEEGHTLPLERKVLKISEKHDLCAIQAPDYRHGEGLKLASDVEVGESLFLVGHPNLRPLIVEKGELIHKDVLSKVLHHIIDKKNPTCKGEKEHIELPMFNIKADLCFNVDRSFALKMISFGGSSGSPVTNKWGNVIGILFAGNREVVNDSMAVKLEDIREFVEGF